MITKNLRNLNEHDIRDTCCCFVDNTHVFLAERVFFFSLTFFVDLGFFWGGKVWEEGGMDGF